MAHVITPDQGGVFALTHGACVNGDYPRGGFRVDTCAMCQRGLPSAWGVFALTHGHVSTGITLGLGVFALTHGHVSTGITLGLGVFAMTHGACVNAKTPKHKHTLHVQKRAR